MIAFQMDSKELKILDEIAKASYRSRSNIINLAIRKYLNKKNGRKS